MAVKILVVEDEQRARIGLCEQIRRLSDEYEVVGEAPNGKRALEMMQSLAPDVVFTDIRMPLMDGLELIENARQLKLRTMFVLVTAYAQFEYAKQAVSLGAVDYLLKPATDEDLRKTLETVRNLMAYGTRTSYSESTRLRSKYPEAHPVIRQVLDIIENGYAKSLNQREIAQSLNVSPEYLSYLFTKETGTNFSKLVRTYRIEKAADYLCSGTFTPQEVGYEVGFTDAKYFSKIFRDEMGEGPSEFAKKTCRKP